MSVISDIFSIHNSTTSSQIFLGSTEVKLFKHQHKTQNDNKDHLILAPSDLFKTDVSFFYKSSSKELNIFLQVPMVKIT
jgi:hypothetical protein